MSKFENIINNRLNQLKENITNDNIKQMLDQLNAMIGELPNNEKGKTLDILSNLQDVGGKLSINNTPTQSGTQQNNDPQNMQSTQDTTQNSSGNNTQQTQTTTPPQQINPEQQTADKAAKSAQVSAYNKQTGYSGV